MASRAVEPSPEDATDALVDGDRVLARGTAQAALAHRDFRRVWSGTFASNIGTWMQNVLLGAYAYTLTKSEAYVGLIFFAQLGPLLLLSNVGGVLADVVDRRLLLLWAQVQQLVFSLVLAGVVATSDDPSRGLLFACVLVIGIGNALGAPALSAILPTLVPKPDLPGAVSLQSVQMNLSRVIGPVIGAVLYTNVGVSIVFVINAGTYLFAIITLLSVHYPHRPAARSTEGVMRRLSEGFRIARADPLVRRVLITLFSMSLFSLVFVGQMPTVANENFGIAPRSTAYGALYAIFGLGAALGAVSVGTWFASIAKERLVRPAFLAFAALLAAFALTRTAWLAFVLAPVLGYAYFVVITSLSTVLQSHIADEVRGRVIALWIMGFGGTVPVGVLIGGVVAHATSITLVLLIGAAAAVVLAAYADLDMSPG